MKPPQQTLRVTIRIRDSRNITNPQPTEVVETVTMTAPVEAIDLVTSETILELLDDEGKVIDETISRHGSRGPLGSMLVRPDLCIKVPEERL